MKIINSHYIPLPEPRWLIVDPKGNVYEQLGTMTVVEDAPAKKGKYGVKTHSHPVVASADIDSYEDKGYNIEVSASLSIADGGVLDDVLINDCTRLCLVKHRTLLYLKFNLVVLKLATHHYEDFDLDEFIEDLKFNGVKLVFPEEEQQEVTLTTYSTDEESMIISDPGEIFFIVPFWAFKDKNGVHIHWDEIFMEFVNQARSYLKLNTKYRYTFKTSVEELKPLVEMLNKDLNDYLDQKEE